MSLDQPQGAGPSRQRHLTSLASPSLGAECPLGAQCPLLARSTSVSDSLQKSRAKVVRDRRNEVKRQDPAVGSSSTSSGSPSSTSSSALFIGPSGSSSSSSSALYADPTGNSTTSYTSYTSSVSASSRSSSKSSSTFSAPWTYTPSRTSSAAASSTYVPGVLLNLTLNGASETQAVYAVEMDFGHSSPSSTSRRRYNSERRRRRERRASSSSQGDVQQIELQVDLGSSDLWVASASCSSSSCKSAPARYDTSQSIDSGNQANLTYQSGSISGEIFWEEVVLGGFGIGYQAYIGANQVNNEDLSGGAYSGVLGLSLPADSVILQQIPGTTSSNPDGATFLDNLFGSGASAPSDRLFSLALARREDVRTTSVLGIGAISSSLCPNPCSPPYIPIISQPSLGATGYTHWRILLQGVSSTVWSDAQHGTGPTTTNITLAGSQVVSKSSPVAVLDSGGVTILVGYKPYADALYAAYGISASSDGLYRMPCTTQLAFSFNFGGIEYAAHPLDMSYPDPSDASQTTCIGVVQYVSNLGSTGDFVMGSAFLKNVYTIFQYPDPTKGVTWQPTVGMISLTNASTASQDFYAVRSLHESLSSVSSQSAASAAGGSASPSSASAPGAGKAHAVASTTIIVACSVVGFFLLAAAAFCAWWFWLRRKFGAAGIVEYGSSRPRGAGHRSDASTSTLRSRKHENAQRQKSLVEGYSDYEGDSWLSTEGDDSIRLGYLPEVAEEDEGSPGRPVARSSVGSSIRTNSAGRGAVSGVFDLSDNEMSPAPLITTLRPDAESTPTRRDLSPSRRTVSFTDEPLALSPSRSRPEPRDLLLDSPTNPFSPPSPYAYPSTNLPAPPVGTGSATATQGSGRTLSMAMSGPFPSPMRSSVARPDTSPMYDIRTSDYFAVIPASGGAAARGRESRRRPSGTVAAPRDGSGSGSVQRSVAEAGSGGLGLVDDTSGEAQRPGNGPRDTMNNNYSV